jgi:CelD/BcsL family acetyltransferase involved in cellulose biosynthesis
VFEYLRNEYNRTPLLTVEPHPVPPGKFVIDLPYSTAPLLRLPRSAEELDRLHGRKWWSTMRRKERRLRENVADVEFRVLASATEIEQLLPPVQSVFEERWSGQYTSFPWKTPEGFQPYADAMLELAPQGRAELAVLLGDGRLLSFAYCLREGSTYYFYQHATTTDPRYQQFSVGKLLVMKLVQQLVHDGRCETLDFMTGASAYKLEWTREQRPIFVRIEEEKTLPGACRMIGRLAYHRVKLYVQFGNPRLRTWAGRLLTSWDAWTAGRRRRTAERSDPTYSTAAR